MVKIFADGARFSEMIELARDVRIKGFTTNPSLMRAVGVSDYEAFACKLVRAIPNHPISFEVFADDNAGMIAQARRIASWGPNVYVKIPITNTQAVSAIPVVEVLQKEGIKVNVTAVFTLSQVEALATILDTGLPSIVSIFAGRIADTGVDPMSIMVASKRALVHAKAKAELLWASTREIFNIKQANLALCDIITVSPALLNKQEALAGKDLLRYSQDTVKEFARDADAAGYHLRGIYKPLQGENLTASLSGVAK